MARTQNDGSMVFRNVRENEDQYIAEMVAKVFVPKYSEFENYSSNIRYSDPTFERKNVRILEINGEIASHVHILTREIQIGKVALDCAGIGCVATPTEFRGRGYNRLLLQHCIEFMVNEGYDISLLNGIPDYYHKFGYANVMPNYSWAIETTLLEKTKSSHSTRKAAEADCPLLDELYQNEFEGKTGIVVRSIPMWWSYLRKMHGDLIVFVNQKDVPEGYIWYEKSDSPNIFEVGASNPLAAQSILAYLAEQGKLHYQREIQGNLHPEQQFVKYVSWNYGGEFKIRFRKYCGWMGRICNLKSMFTKLLPEFKKRLKCSEFASWTGSLSFATDIGTVTIKIDATELSLSEGAPNFGLNVSIKQENLLQLIFGFHDIQELIFAGLIVEEESAQNLLKVLFPKQMPGMSCIDWY